MPMRRTIGISFACLVTSACATSKTPEESTSHYADEAAKVPDPCCRLVTIVGRRQFGKAAWYDFVGKKTASGEILDKVTATAAHRALPLPSYARVTNLNNSRSVIVKFNDRGPDTRGRIIDLSPRAADALDMKHAGVAPVVIEPLVYQTSATVAAVQTPGAMVAQ